MKKTIAIIGAGFGGLSLGIRLQSSGYQVTIYEKQEKVGGHAYQLKKDGYTFDMGPSLITAPDIIEAIFESANEDMEDYLDLIKLDPFYRIYYHDGSYLDYTGDTDQMKKQLSSFHPDDGEGYDKFMKYSKELYRIVIEERLGAQPFLGMKDFFNAAPDILKTQSMFSCYHLAKKYFKDERSRFAFSFHPLFIGGNPFDSPGLYLMIPYLEKTGGVWFTKGGMYTVVEALEKVFLKKGGVIKTSTEVTKLIIEDSIIKSVKTKDTTEDYDAVVSNAHFAHTYKDLIKDEDKKSWSTKKIKSKKYSMSTYLAYIGTNKQFPQLLHHTLILSERYKELVKDIFDRKILADDFSMYLHAPTRTDPSMAPEGGESMYVLVPVPNLDSEIDWDIVEPFFTQKILDFLEDEFGLEGFKDSIKVLETFTPKDFELERNNYIGSAWGVQPTLFQSANFRPHNKSEDFKNLYLVGASTHPGAGVPGVMLTAETTEKLIKEDIPLG
jgi:phytoene desaturase